MKITFGIGETVLSFYVTLPRIVREKPPVQRPYFKPAEPARTGLKGLVAEVARQKAGQHTRKLEYVSLYGEPAQFCAPVSYQTLKIEG